MKKKVICAAVLASVLSIGLTPKASEAFWPFDKWAQKGEVKGEQTDKVKRPGIIQSLFVKNSPTPAIDSVSETAEIEDEISEEKVNQMVKGRIVSAAQRKLMLEKLAQIRAKKAELKKLQEAFRIWLKENKIDPKELIATSSATPQPGKTTRQAPRPERVPTTTTVR